MLIDARELNLIKSIFEKETIVHFCEFNDYSWWNVCEWR